MYIDSLLKYLALRWTFDDDDVDEGDDNGDGVLYVELKIFCVMLSTISGGYLRYES